MDKRESGWSDKDVKVANSQTKRGYDSKFESGSRASKRLKLETVDNEPIVDEESVDAIEIYLNKNLGPSSTHSNDISIEVESTAKENGSIPIQFSGENLIEMLISNSASGKFHASRLETKDEMDCIPPQGMVTRSKSKNCHLKI